MSASVPSAITDKPEGDLGELLPFQGDYEASVASGPKCKQSGTSIVGHIETRSC